MVVDGDRQRHQNARPADGCELGDGGGAGAADHQRRGGEQRRHVGEERRQIGGNLCLRVGDAHAVDVLGAALLGDAQAHAQFGWQRGQRIRHHVGEHARAERAAQHQQPDVVSLRHVRRAGDGGDAGPHRVADQHSVYARRNARRGGKTQRQRIGGA